MVVGGLDGIGRAAARVFAEAGARVMVVGATETEVVRALGDLCTATDDEDALQGVEADLASLDDVRYAFQEADRLFGGVDALLYFVDGNPGSVTESDSDEIAHALDAGVRGYVVACQEALARMRRRGAGHIITVAPRSAPGLDRTSDVYAITRAAVGAFTESLGVKASSVGVHVSLIEPDLSPSAAEDDAHYGPVAACLLQCVTRGTQARRVFVHAAPRRTVL